MLPLALFSWWYTTAWRTMARRIQQRLNHALDFFSVGLLMRTLFDPFRQIAAVKGQGNVNVQFHAWLDRTFSRFVGAAVRGTFIFVGSIVALFILLLGFVQMLLWPLVPLLPVIALLGLLMGWKL